MYSDPNSERHASPRGRRESERERNLLKQNKRREYKKQKRVGRKRGHCKYPLVYEADGLYEEVKAP